MGNFFFNEFSKGAFIINLHGIHCEPVFWQDSRYFLNIHDIDPYMYVCIKGLILEG